MEFYVRLSFADLSRQDLAASGDRVDDIGALLFFQAFDKANQMSPFFRCLVQEGQHLGQVRCRSAGNA